MIARDYVYEIWRKTGAVGDSPRAPTGTQASIGLNALNQAIAMLNADGMLFFSEVIEQCASTGNPYITIGKDVTADINAERPAKVRAVYSKYQNSSPIKIDQVAFSDILNYQSPLTARGTPSVFAYQPLWPIAKVHFNLSPMAGLTLYVVYNYQMARVGMDDEMNLPPEYFSLITWLGAMLVAQREGMEEFDVCRAEYLREADVIRRTNMDNTPLSTYMMNYNQSIVRRNPLVG